MSRGHARQVNFRRGMRSWRGELSTTYARFHAIETASVRKMSSPEWMAMAPAMMGSMTRPTAWPGP
eukprot:scaffold9442_cov33-Tisochrysis_lutea.AAC.3